MPYEAPEIMVRQWYQAYLNREPDPQASYWLDKLRRGEAPAFVLSEILASDEYWNLSGGNASGYVNKLIYDLAGMNAAATDPYYYQMMPMWIDMCNRMERQQVAWQIITHVGAYR